MKCRIAGPDFELLIALKFFDVSKFVISIWLYGYRKIMVIMIHNSFSFYRTADNVWWFLNAPMWSFQRNPVSGIQISIQTSIQTSFGNFRLASGYSNFEFQSVLN